MRKLNASVKLIIYDTLMVIVFLMVLFTLITKQYYNYRTNYTYDYLEDTNLAYWHCKYEIVQDMDNFVQNKSKDTNLSSLVLLNLCDEYGVDVRLPLSQGLVESHYGTKGLATRTNSIFNMGAYDGWKYDKILGIHKYPHPNTSIEPYLKLLTRDYLSNGKTENELLENFVNLNGSRYASYKGYEIELKLVWDELNSTTRLDSLLQKYTHYKLELNR